MPNVDVVSIILGWLFGILSPSIVGRINRKYKKGDLYKGIRRELHEVRSRLLLVSFMLGRDFGRFDREYLTWSLQLCEDFNDAKPHESHITLTKLLLKKNDKEITLYVEKSRRDRSKSRALKKESLGIMEMNLPEFSLFNIEFQTLLFDIKSKISLLNQEIDDTRQMHYMSFDSSITNENHTTIKNDLFRRYAFIQALVDEIINKITETLNCNKY